jgi:hypothetical protein
MLHGRILWQMSSTILEPAVWGPPAMVKKIDTYDTIPTLVSSSFVRTFALAGLTKCTSVWARMRDGAD